MAIEKPKETREGLHINGWRVSWYLAAAAVVIIGNAFVAQYRIGQLEHSLEQIARTVEHVNVLENRILHLERNVRWHRVREHSERDIAPDGVGE